MARLEDLLSGLRVEDLPEQYADLAPILTALESVVTGLSNAFRGNLTLNDNISVERIDVSLSHGVAQTVSLKKLRRVGSVIGYSCGTDSGGTGHAFLVPPEAKPGVGFQQAQVVAYFRDATAKRVQCSIWIESTGASTSKLAGYSIPVYANNAAAVAGGLPVGSFYRTGADPDPVCVVH